MTPIPAGAIPAPWWRRLLPVALTLAGTGVLLACSGATSGATIKSPTEQGRETAGRLGCLSCHSTSGSAGVGPSWKGLWGRETRLIDGTTVMADEAYVRRSVRDPQAQRVAGFTTAMPALSPTDAELDALVAYVRSLGG